VAERGIRLEVVKLPETARGCVLLPQCWVVERRLCFDRPLSLLDCDYERLPETVAGLHFVALACLMPHRLVVLAAGSLFHARAWTS